MSSISKLNFRYFLKLVLVSLFVFTNLALITSWNAPATGYEPSIYQSTPIILWISIILSVMLGISIIIFSISDDWYKKNQFWLFGFFLIIWCYIICLSLIIIRGYYMWCIYGDPATHIGEISEIIAQSHIPKNLIYPITHIFLAEITLVTNLNLTVLHKIVPLIYGVLFIIFIYYFSREVTSNYIVSLLAVIISCTFVNGWYINLSPNHLSNLFFPFVLYLIYKYLKEKTFPWILLLILTLILYPVFHPVPTIFLGLLFLTIWIPGNVFYLYYTFTNNKNNFLKNDAISLKKVFIPLLILIVWSIFWISMFSLWGYSIKNIYNIISAEEGPTHFSNLMDQILYAQKYGINVIEIAMREMIGHIIIFIITILALIMLWKKYFIEQKNYYLFSLYGPFGMVYLFIIGLFLFYLYFSPLRLLIYATIIGTVISAYFIWFILVNNIQSEIKIKNSLKKIFILILLSSLFLFGLLNLFPSSYNLTPNYQTTKSEIIGMNYFFSYRNVNIPIVGISIAPGRFADMLLTPEEREIHNVPYYLNDNKVPWHFNYNFQQSLATSYEKETNLIITKKDKIIYTDLFVDIAQNWFVKEDFERLRDDSGISLIYSNGGFDLWTIAGKRKEI